MQQLTRLREEVEQWTGLESRLSGLGELIEMAEAESDESLYGELAADLRGAQKELERRELALLLSGRYDDRDAFVTVQAGMGGTDAQDWAEMMLRMYMRWAEARGYTVNLVDQSDGDEAGIKSATFELRGPYAYGNIRAEFRRPPADPALAL